MIAENILRESAEALKLIESRTATLDDVLDGSQINPEWRRTVSSILFLYFRRKKWIDGLLAAKLSRFPSMTVMRIMKIASVQMLLQDKIGVHSAVNVAVDVAKKAATPSEAKLVNAVLRNILRDAPQMSDAPAAVLPDWILQKWERVYSAAELEILTRSFLTPAGAVIRVCRDFAAPERAESVPGWGGFRFCRVSDIMAAVMSEEFAAGHYYVQDPATSLAVSLADFEHVKSALDVCAAPGGKAIMLSERLNVGALLTAADRSGIRNRRTMANFRRHGVTAPVITAKPEEIKGKFDLVLLDVPCSNTGVFRRRPDALWRLEAGEFADIIAVQRTILAAAAKLVADGGQLVYSTCSLEAEENSLQIKQFIADHGDFHLRHETQLLPALDHDGAYAALLQKGANHA